VLYGSNQGLTATGDDLWTQNSAGVEGTTEAGDLFGITMAAGDFDDNGYTDLAIASPFETLGGIDSAGGVNVLYGSSGGLTATGDQFWHQDSTGVLGTPEELDSFGFALATGDFDDDGVRDLAIGEPGATAGGMLAAGAVHILFGRSGSGLGEAGDELWSQATSGVVGAPAVEHEFGYSLAAGDFGGNGVTDLAIAVPSFNDGSAGAVQVLDGTSSGLTASGDQLLGQGTDGIQGTPSAEDWIAASMRSGDFDGDGKRDLAFGNCYDNNGDYGALQVLYGGTGGLSTEDQFYMPADFFALSETEGNGFGDVGSRGACI